MLRQSLTALVSAVVLPGLLVIATPAHAQLVQREKPADKAGDKAADKAGDKPADKAGDKKPAASDDDDILAPKSDGTKKGDDKPTEQKPKSFAVGLVAIVPVGEAGKTLADKVTSGLLKELGSGRVFDAAALAVTVKGATASAGTDEAAAKQALTEGTDTLKKAQALLEKLQFGKAKKGFELAAESLEKAAPVLAEPQLLIDCHVGLAEVAARQGQDAEEDKELTAAAALNPEHNLDKKKYPGAFISAYDKARDKLMKAARGTVVVDATGAGSAVEIDGRATQDAPLTLTNVPAGRHLVRALREGLPAFGTIVDVKGGESVTATPGFISKDGKSYVDDLQNNRLSAEAAKAVAEAAKAANQRGAVVGVVSKDGGSAPVQLVLVDAATGAMKKLPALAFTADMLDISIETLKARDAIEAALGADKPDPKAFSADAIAVLIEGAKAGATANMATLALRYDVQPLKVAPKSRLLTDDKKKVDDEDTAAAGSGDDEGGDKKVLAAGKNGTRKRLDDEEDPYANKGGGGSSGSTVPDPDAPLTDQPWFWPTVLGGGAGALVLITSATVVTLVATKVLPDPRPASGAEIHVAIP